MQVSRWIRQILVSVTLAIILVQIIALVQPIELVAGECDPDPVPQEPDFRLELCSPSANELQTEVVPGGLLLSWQAPPRSSSTLVSDVIATVLDSTRSSWGSIPAGNTIPGITLSGTSMAVKDRRIEIAVIRIGDTLLTGTIGVDPVRIAWSSIHEATSTGLLGGEFRVDASNADTDLQFLIPFSGGDPDTSVVPGLRIRFASGTPVGKEFTAIFDIEDFEGYHVWRWFSDPTVQPQVWGEYSRLADLSQPANAWQATPLASRFGFLDRAVFDGDVYHYAVTSYDQGFNRQKSPGQGLGVKVDSPLPMSVTGGDGEFVLAATTVKVDFLRPPPAQFRSVAAVPNPFRQAECDPVKFDITCTIRFIRMPASSIMSIYTLGGDLIDEISHENTEVGTIRWDMRNADGEEVTSGVYIFKVVDLVSGEQSFGRLVIIR